MPWLERILKEHSDKVEVMTAALMEWETIDAEQIEDIGGGREPRPPKDWKPRNQPGSGGGRPSGDAPVAMAMPATEV